MYPHIEGLNVPFEVTLQRAIDSIRFHCLENHALPIFTVAVRDGGQTPLYITCDVINQAALCDILRKSLMDAQIGVMMDRSEQ